MATDYKKYLQLRQNLEFVDVNISNQSRTKCKRCKLLLIKPFQTDCGFRCCCECIDQINNQSIDKCPFCGMLLQFTSHIHRDKSMENEIFKMKVKCLSKTCYVNISTKDILFHLENCIHIKNRCSMCYNLLIIQNDNLQANLLLNRNGRICQNCLRKTQTVEIRLETGNKCPNNCSIETYDNIECHLKNCPKQIISCCFNEFGCIEKLRRENLDSHVVNYHKIYGEVLNENVIRSIKFFEAIPESSKSIFYSTPIPERGGT